jgi:hypothetical protein
MGILPGILKLKNFQKFFGWKILKQEKIWKFPFLLAKL